MSDASHEIRLVGPWAVDWVGPEDAPADALTVDRGTFPINWQKTFGDVLGTVRFTRKFNRPTGLGNGQQVWLSIPKCSGMVSVELNSRVLAILPEEELSVRLDVTSVLRLHNKLCLEVTADPEADGNGGSQQPVRLVIIEPSPESHSAG